MEEENGICSEMDMELDISLWLELNMENCVWLESVSSELDWRMENEEKFIFVKLVFSIDIEE